MGETKEFLFVNSLTCTVYTYFPDINEIIRITDEQSNRHTRYKNQECEHRLIVVCRRTQSFFKALFNKGVLNKTEPGFFSGPEVSGSN